jgi:hypothetical protein
MLFLQAIQVVSQKHGRKTQTRPANPDIANDLLAAIV